MKNVSGILAAIIASSLLAIPAAAQEEERAADHEELRALRDAFAGALNQQDFEALKGLVTEDLSFTSISNETLNGAAELEAYWTKLFDGEESVMTGLAVAPKADALTKFLGDDVGIARGSSQDTYQFRKVGDRKMTSRWTAVVRKVDGKWKVSAVHMSGNVLDNPVLDATKSVGLIKMIVAGVVGLLLGALIFRRRRKS